MGVEEVFLRIIIGRGCNHDEVSILIRCCAIKGGRQIQFLFSQIFLDVIILNGRNLVIDLLHLLGDDIYCCYMIVLRQQCGDTHTDIAGSCYCYIHIFIFLMSHRKLLSNLLLIIFRTRMTRMERMTFYRTQKARKAQKLYLLCKYLVCTLQEHFSKGKHFCDLTFPFGPSS